MHVHCCTSMTPHDKHRTMSDSSNPKYMKLRPTHGMHHTQSCTNNLCYDLRKYLCYYKIQYPKTQLAKSHKQKSQKVGTVGTRLKT